MAFSINSQTSLLAIPSLNRKLHTRKFTFHISLAGAQGRISRLPAYGGRIAAELEERQFEGARFVVSEPAPASLTGEAAYVEPTESRSSGEEQLGFEGGSGGGGEGGSFGGDGSGGSGGGDQGEGEGGSEEKKGKMSMSQKITLAYAALVGVGGIIGYIKSGSQKSLASGGLSSLLLYYVYTQLPSRPAFASSLGLGLSAALLAIMGSRYKRSGKIFPAGVVSLVSLVMTAGYLHGIIRSNH